LIVGGSTCAIIIFLLADQSSPFFSPNVEGVVVDRRHFRFLIFQRYSRSKSEVVRNRAELRTFFALPIFGVRAPKICTEEFYPWLVAHHVNKFGDVISTGLKVTSHNTLNFGPIFEIFRVKNCWRPLSLMPCTLASLGHSA